MLIPLRPGELQRLIPAVATAGQFRFSLGSPPRDPAAGDGGRDWWRHHIAD